MDKMIDYLIKGWHCVKNICEKCIQDMENRKEIQRRNQIAIQMNSIVLQVRDELYDCFHSANYHNLNQVVVPANIRTVGWLCLGNSTLIQYSISKNNTSINALPHAVLQSIQSDMNKDIASTANTLLNMYGYAYMAMYYPYIYKGIYVTKIRDTGLDVEIEICI